MRTITLSLRAGVVRHIHTLDHATGEVATTGVSCDLTWRTRSGLLPELTLTLRGPGFGPHDDVTIVLEHEGGSHE